MAADNLLLVHSRIGTLDIYAVAAMVWAAALYLRGRPALAGVVLGVGACAKEVAPYVLLAVLVLELLRWLRDAGRCWPAALRAGLGAWPPWRRRRHVPRRARTHRADRAAVRPADRQARADGAVRPPVHMFSYAAHQTSPHGRRGSPPTRGTGWSTSSRSPTCRSTRSPDRRAEPDRAPRCTSSG